MRTSRARTLVWGAALTAAMSWLGDARAACPSHERVNTILRFLESREPLRGLRASRALHHKSRAGSLAPLGPAGPCGEVK